MICSKCTHWKPATINVRMTPTFYHSPIFDPYEHTQPPTRCSATYHSTVFDGAKIHRQAKCCCKKARKVGQQKVSRPRNKTRNQAAIRCSSVDRLQRQVQFNTETRQDLNRLTSRGISHHKLLWYNPDKEVQLMNCSNCYQHGLSRERKLIQLKSNPFYPQLEQTNQIISCGCQYTKNCPQTFNSQCCSPECCCQQSQQEMAIDNPQASDVRNENNEQNKDMPIAEEETTFGRKQGQKQTENIAQEQSGEGNSKVSKYGKTVKKNKNQKKGEAKCWAVTKSRLK